MNTSVLKKLLSEGKTEKVIDCLLILYKNSDLINDTVHLSHNFSKLKKDRLQNLHDPEILNRDLNKIIEASISLIDSLEENKAILSEEEIKKLTSILEKNDTENIQTDTKVIKPSIQKKIFFIILLTAIFYSVLYIDRENLYVFNSSYLDLIAKTVYWIVGGGIGLGFIGTLMGTTMIQALNHHLDNTKYEDTFFEDIIPEILIIISSFYIKNNLLETCFKTICGVFIFAKYFIYFLLSIAVFALILVVLYLIFKVTILLIFRNKKYTVKQTVNNVKEDIPKTDFKLILIDVLKVIIVILNFTFLVFILYILKNPVLLMLLEKYT